MNIHLTQSQLYLFIGGVFIFLCLLMAFSEDRGKEGYLSGTFLQGPFAPFLLAVVIGGSMWLGLPQLYASEGWIFFGYTPQVEGDVSAVVLGVIFLIVGFLGLRRRKARMRSRRR